MEITPSMFGTFNCFCLEPLLYKNDVECNGCNKLAHKECLDLWYRKAKNGKKSCPFCKIKLGESDNDIVNNYSDDDWD